MLHSYIDDIVVGHRDVEALRRLRLANKGWGSSVA